MKSKVKRPNSCEFDMMSLKVGLYVIFFTFLPGVKDKGSKLLMVEVSLKYFIKTITLSVSP